jgi:hypothetical protein
LVKRRCASGEREGRAEVSAREGFVLGESVDDGATG